MLDQFDKPLNQLPQNFVEVESFPTDPAVGNDDYANTAAIHDPYKISNLPIKYVSINRVVATTYANNDKTVNPAGVGQLCSYDWPQLVAFDSAAGNVNHVVEVRAQFREFVRLQIGKNAPQGYRMWYRVSDFRSWRHHVKVRKEQAGWTTPSVEELIGHDNW